MTAKPAMLTITIPASVPADRRWGETEDDGAVVDVKVTFVLLPVAIAGVVGVSACGVFEHTFWCGVAPSRRVWRCTGVVALDDRSERTYGSVVAL